MNILLATNQFPPMVGGVTSTFENLCRHSNGKVQVFTQKPPNRMLDWRAWDGAQPYRIHRIERFYSPTGTGLPKPFSWPVRYVSDNLLHHWKVSSEFARFLDEVCPDVVCFGTVHANYWLAPVARKRKVPVVFYAHGEETSGTGIRRSRLDGNGPRNAFRQADAVIAQGQFTADNLVGLGVDPSRIHFFSPGVDTRRFEPGPKDTELIARYGLAGKRVLLTLSRLDERKGHDRVLQAMPSILSAIPDALYLIVGAGGMRDRLLNIVGELGIAEHVLFVGAVPNDAVAAHYRLGDVFIMANRTLPDGDTEGFGLVFIEAGACERPVIGGKAGGVPAAIDHGSTGLLVDGESPGEIAAAAIELLGNPDRCAQMGVRGLEKARANNWASKAVEFEELMAKVVAGASS